MHLKDLNLAPPGNWRYTQPQSGFTMQAITFGSLLKQVAQHRANRGYPTEGSLADEVETAICQALSAEDQTVYCDNGFRPPRAVHWNEVKNFLRSAVEWMKQGEVVPQEEAERRAHICTNCIYNVPMAGCAVCQTTLAGLREAVLQCSTTNDINLKACGICGCDNKLQVHAPVEALAASGKQFKYPEWCWKGKALAHEH